MGLLYGVLLCNARHGRPRVSGIRHIRGETNTMPLLVEIPIMNINSYRRYIASLLAMLALITLVVKTVLVQHLTKGSSDN
jgi:sulfate transport system permease protein